jgi:hypothetical protein
MSIQPEHALKPAFEKAREWAREQEKLLTQRQRDVYDALKHRQAKEREIRQKWLDGVREQLREREKNQKPKPELALKPPVHVADPEIRRLARLAIANEKRLERLDARHHGETVKMLKQFEQERAKQIANDLGSAWLKAVGKAAEQEKDRSREKERDVGKDLDRSR